MHGMLDGAARAPAFTPQYHDPSDDGGETVPDEVWATDEFQDKLWNFTREAGGPSIKQPAERNIQFVRPRGAFVFKTTDRAGSKIFINVCSSPQVPKPPEITPEMLQEEAPRVRIPLSMGEPREDSDKTGKPCTVYDAIMHPDPVDRAKTEKDMKQFIVELCLQWIEQKHSLVLSRRVKFPKGLSAKGEPEIQTIRRNTNQMVAEVGKDAYQPQQPEPIEEPEFAVSLGASQVTISVALPRCSSLAADGEVELEHSSRRLFLKVEGVYKLTVPLPVAVAKEKADAEFNVDDRVLTVWLPVGGASGDAGGGDSSSSTHTPAAVGSAGSRQPANSLVVELD